MDEWQRRRSERIFLNDPCISSTSPAMNRHDHCPTTICASQTAAVKFSMSTSMTTATSTITTATVSNINSHATITSSVAGDIASTAKHGLKPTKNDRITKKKSSEVSLRKP